MFLKLRRLREREGESGGSERSEIVMSKHFVGIVIIIINFIQDISEYLGIGRVKSFLLL